MKNGAWSVGVVRENLLVALIDQSDDDFAITIMTDDAKVLTSDQSGEWLYYYARYAADKRIDLIVRISSSADWATYSASFAWR